MSKKTLIIGASNNPERYAYKAARELQNHGHEFVPYGVKHDSVFGKTILNVFPENETNVDTVTLYINPSRQVDYYHKILALKPKRIIFNPGTENPEFEKMAEAQNVEALEACTLVLLATGQY